MPDKHKNIKKQKKSDLQRLNEAEAEKEATLAFLLKKGIMSPNAYHQIKHEEASRPQN